MASTRQYDCELKEYFQFEDYLLDEGDIVTSFDTPFRNVKLDTPRVEKSICPVRFGNSMVVAEFDHTHSKLDVSVSASGSADELVTSRKLEDKLRDMLSSIE
jgi:hypothetical protein